MSKTIDLSMPSGAILASQTYTNHTGDQHPMYNAENPFPEEPLGDRLIVKSRKANTKYKRIESSMELPGHAPVIMYKAEGSDVVITEEQLSKIIQELELQLQVADVVAVGNMKDTDLKPGDVVRVYLNQWTAKLDIAGEEYLIYNERTIITKLK